MSAVEMSVSNITEINGTLVVVFNEGDRTIFFLYWSTAVCIYSWREAR